MLPRIKRIQLSVVVSITMVTDAKSWLVLVERWKTFGLCWFGSRKADNFSILNVVASCFGGCGVVVERVQTLGVVATVATWFITRAKTKDLPARRADRRAISKSK
jgi:hypothetical protein